MSETLKNRLLPTWFEGKSKVRWAITPTDEGFKLRVMSDTLEISPFPT